MNTQFKKGVLELCVLSLLEKKDCYGYEIVELVSSTIEVSEGTIYPLLSRLNQLGYFNTYLKESAEGAPRKYYGLTDAGRTALQELLAQWRQFNADIDQLLQYQFKGETS